MRYSALQTALTVAIALCVSSWLRRLAKTLGRAIASVVLLSLIASCASTSRTATSAVSSSRFQVSSLRDSSLVERVEVHDTILEVTTITVDRNDKGDTLRQSIVTDRERVRNAADVRSKTVDVKVVRDTVYIDKRDSVLVERHQPSDVGHQTSILKWIFAVICAIIVLIIVVKLGLRKVL